MNKETINIKILSILCGIFLLLSWMYLLFRIPNITVDTMNMLEILGTLFLLFMPFLALFFIVFGFWIGEEDSEEKIKEDLE